MIVFVLNITNLQSQNLVLNPSFESNYNCNYIPKLDSLPCTPWRCANLCTADFFTTCPDDTLFGVPKNFTGNYYPHTGNSYVGLVLFSNFALMEHVVGEFSEPLIKGQQYIVSFFTKLAFSSSDFVTNSIGVYISKENKFANRLAGDSYYKSLDSNIKANIQSNLYINDTSWVEIKGIYTALGGEKFITLGMFWLDDEKINAISKVVKAELATNPIHVKKLVGLIKKRTMKSNNMVTLKNGKDGSKISYYLIDDVNVEEVK